VAGLNAGSEMVIDEAQAVNKSYPDFYAHLQSLGAHISLSNTFKLHE
jgi:3-phosphoshikimate 1-carboxyvinyltransferase